MRSSSGLPSRPFDSEGRSALAHADVGIVHDDRPEWRELRAADFAGMKRMAVIDGRRILRQEAMAGAELLVLGG